MSSSPLPPTSGLEPSVVLPYFLAVVTGLVGWFGAQFTAGAKLQETVLSASRALVTEWQTQHAQDSARISALEDKLKIAESEVVRMRGEVNGSLQREESLRRFVLRNGLTPPPRLASLRDPNGSDP